MASSQYSNVVARELIRRLALEGRRLVGEALRNINIDYTHRTRNLHDSYGSAVFYNGVLQKNTIYYSTPQAQVMKKWYSKEPNISGHGEIVHFFEEYQGAKNGIELVVIAAMPYASILESGGGSLEKKYRVISGISSSMDSLTKSYKGTIRRITTSRVKQ